MAKTFREKALQIIKKYFDKIPEHVSYQKFKPNEDTLKCIESVYYNEYDGAVDTYNILNLNGTYVVKEGNIYQLSDEDIIAFIEHDKIQKQKQEEYKIISEPFRKKYRELCDEFQAISYDDEKQYKAFAKKHS